MTALATNGLTAAAGSYSFLAAAPYGPQVKHRISRRPVWPAVVAVEFAPLARAIWQAFVIDRLCLNEEQLGRYALRLDPPVNRRSLSPRSPKPYEAIAGPDWRRAISELCHLVERPIVWDREQGGYRDARSRKEAVAYARELQRTANSTEQAAVWVRDRGRAADAIAWPEHRRAMCEWLVKSMPTSRQVGWKADRICEALKQAGFTTASFYLHGKGHDFGSDSWRTVARELRESGLRLCADPLHGYWIGDADDAAAWIAGQMERGRMMRLHVDALVRSARRTFPVTDGEIAACGKGRRAGYSDAWRKWRDKGRNDEAKELALETAKQTRDALKPQATELFARADDPSAPRDPETAALIFTKDERSLLREYQAACWCADHAGNRKRGWERYGYAFDWWALTGKIAA